MTDSERKTDRRLGFSFLLFTVFFIAAMFLPRLVTKGMFGDGVLYAAMARNLAEGSGSWWAPYFSSSYWTAVVKPAYYENPPLMLWIQAGFFRLLGDYWWVEKLYSFLLLGFNCFLLYRIWTIPLSPADPRRHYAWLPLFFFYLIPTVIWGSSNNLMDSTMLSFCLLAMYCISMVLFQKRQPTVWWTLAGVFIFAGLLTKGPVALYPVAARFLFTLIVEPRRPLPGIGYSAGLGIAIVLLFAGLLWSVPAAREFFQNYWEQRLSVALAGGREDGLNTGWKRLFIFKILIQELLPMLAVTLVLWGLATWKKFELAAEPGEKSWAFFYLSVGCAATVPLLASTRQTGMYLTSGLPMFALAAGYFNLPVLRRFFSMPILKKETFAKRLRWFSAIALAITLVYSGTIAGTPGREQALQRDLAVLQGIIPAGETIGACEPVMKNFVFHTYFQRFHHVELTRDRQTTRFFATDAGCDREMQAELQASGFERPVFKGEVLNLYAR